MVVMQTFYYLVICIISSSSLKIVQAFQGKPDIQFLFELPRILVLFFWYPWITHSLAFSFKFRKSIFTSQIPGFLFLYIFAYLESIPNIFLFLLTLNNRIYSLCIHRNSATRNSTHFFQNSSWNSATLVQDFYISY